MKTKLRDYVLMSSLLLSPCLAQPTFAQGQTQEIVINMKNESLAKAFKRLEKATKYKVLYASKDVEGVTVSRNIKASNVQEAMIQLLTGKGLTFKIDKQFITVTKGTLHVSKGAGEFYDIKGKVVDENGVELPGVYVLLQGTKTGTTTGVNGEFSLKARKGDVLKFSFVGYKPEYADIKNPQRVLKIDLRPDAKNLDEVQVVAFGTQKKESVVSSITTVKPGDLKVSSSDLTTSFAGRIPGMVAWQTGGLPGGLTENEMNTKFYIRGITSFQSGANTDPLILIDGVESSKLELSRIQVEDIESFSVLKDASATAMYGARGANGVIKVTTKKGEEGSVYTNFRYESVLTQPTSTIDVVDPITYMRMYDQAQLGRNPNASPQYSVDYINKTASGKYPSWLYPHTDWYKQLFKDFAWNHRAGINIRGGSKKVQYYAAINYNRDEGMIKTDRLNDFDCNITNNQTQFRTNLNIDLRSGIKLVINSVATLDKYHGPQTSQTEAYYYAFNASPVDFAPTYPADETHNFPHILFGTTASMKTNPYMEIQKGYINRTRFSTTNRAEYIHNLSKLVKGLEFRASASLVQTGYYSNEFYTIPYKYYLSSYDNETGKFTLADVENSRASRTLNASEGDRSTDTRITYTGTLIHQAAWGNHQTSLTAVVQSQERTFTPISDVLNGQPQRNLTYSARGNYGYKDRYFIEGSFGYNGSERFAKSKRFGFFPAVGGAWVASNEPWMKKLDKYISYLKFRLSWGKVGNDGIVETPRFVFLPQIGTTSAGTGGQDPTANAGAQFVRKQIVAYANPNILWEIAEQKNLGIEAKLFGGLIEAQADIYQEIRHNIISTRTTIPANMGIEVDPLANIGKTDSRGVDLSLKVQKAFSNDCWMILNGTLTYNKTKYKEVEEATNKPAWQRKVGHEISQPIGYIAEGLFRDQAEIDNSPRQDGDVMPGDIKYRDINHDGVIDVNDATYIGYPETPRLIYGFTGFINYKGWELNFAFQGSGQRSFFINPVKVSPFYGDHAMLKAIYDSHWSEDNQDTHAFWPRLSTSSIAQHNPQEDWYNSSNAEVRKSTYFMRNCSFLRCTNIEIAYNLPKKFVSTLGLKLFKLSLKVNNAFCLTNFKLWDVELGESGFNYPIQRTYSAAINISF
nr:TonB-dependent receptor [uncultured Prevotella sp.]